MKQKNAAVILTLLSVSMYLTSCATQQAIEPLSSLTPEEIRQIEETTWRLELQTNINNAYIDAIQISIFETDPLPLLKEARIRSAQLNKDKNLTAFDRQIDLEVDWDFLFAEVSGREVFLLKTKTGKKNNPIFSSSTDNGTKWIVTKVSQKKDGTFAVWIIPFNAIKGQQQIIELNDANAFDTSSL